MVYFFTQYTFDKVNMQTIKRHKIVLRVCLSLKPLDIEWRQLKWVSPVQAEWGLSSND